MTASFTVLNDRKDESIDRAGTELGKEVVLRGKIRSPILVISNWNLNGDIQE